MRRPGRDGVAVVLAVAAAVAAVGAILALYLKTQIADRDRFADRTVAALEDSAVRDVVARQVVVGVVERGSPDLISARPLLETAVETVVSTGPFRSLVRTTAQQAHSLLFDHGNAFVFDVADTGTVVLSAVRSLAPDIAAKLPANADATLVDLRERPFAQDTLAAADRLRRVAVVLPILALLLLMGALATAQDRSRAFARFALALGITATVADIALGTARTLVVRSLDGTEEIPTADLRAAAYGVWDALLGDLAGLLLIAAVVGFVLAAGVLSAVDPQAIRRQAARFTRRPQSRVALGARGAVLTVAGIAVLLDPTLALRAIAFLAGAALIYAGSTELLTALGRTPHHDSEPERLPRRRIAVVALAAVLTFAAASGAAALVLHENTAQTSATPIAGCNSLANLCDRRLNEILWPGTHNSMAAADVAGWSIPDQRRSIPRQLQDGIRLFLLDPHYGRVLGNGRVQTDFQAEGRNANKVAAELSPDALAAVDRLGVNLTAGSGARGAKEVFLCHTVCELGATRFTETLTAMRTFLQVHPSTVLMMILENYVTDEDLQRAFAATNTEHYAATLKRGAPLPTLQELIADDKRLVVFTEEPPTGAVPWLNDAFTYIQDTPLGNRSAGQLATKCARYRGTEDSPFLMLNNWVERFPPSPTANRPALTKDFLDARIARCAKARAMPVSLIATDFYEQGDLIGVAHDVNAAR